MIAKFEFKVTWPVDKKYPVVTVPTPVPPLKTVTNGYQNSSKCTTGLFSRPGFGISLTYLFEAFIVWP